MGDSEFLRLLTLFATHLQTLNASRFRTVRLAKP